MLKISTKHLQKKKALGFVHVLATDNTKNEESNPLNRKSRRRCALVQELIVWHHSPLQRHERDTGGQSLALTMSIIMVWLAQRVLNILDVIRK
jgi:hypothetical protein